MNNNEEARLVLVDDEGNEHIFVEYERIIMEDEREFALLLAADELHDDNAELYVFEVVVDEDGEESYQAVEDAETIQEVEDAYHYLTEFEDEDEETEE